MNKKLMIFGIVGMFALAIVSAVVVDYLSNTATADVTVESPMSIQFAKIGAVDVNGEFDAAEDWTNTLIMDKTTGLSTSELGVKVVNNADITIADKTLELTVSNNLLNVDCDDISSLMFWDTATQIQINKGYQELSSLCSDKGNYVVYTIDINSLGAGQTFRYPVKLTFNNVAPTDYTFSAVLLNKAVIA